VLRNLLHNYENKIMSLFYIDNTSAVFKHIFVNIPYLFVLKQNRKTSVYLSEEYEK